MYVIIKEVNSSPRHEEMCFEKHIGFSFGKQGGIMDYKANIPIYLQVIDDIKKRILTGEIKLGDKLPSTRELAVQYTVNPNTAARIYNELEQCGLCYTKRGLGTFVSEDVNLIDTLKAEISNEIIETFVSGMTSLGFSKDEIINLIKNYHE